MTALWIILGFFTGGLIGFLVAWFVKGKELAFERRAAEELRKDSEKSENKFRAIAADVLRLNSEDFLKLAQRDLNKTKELVNTNIHNKEKGFEKLVELVSNSVKSVEDKVSRFEKERGEQFGALGESIKQVLVTGAKIDEATTTLKTVLSSSSSIRGRWGETVLKNLLEESGLTEGIDFFIQETVSNSEAELLRPDVIINLPGELRLAVDSKASLEEFFKAIEEKQPEKKAEHIQKFVVNLRTRIKDLSSKEYQKYIDTKIPYVVMFIPGEAAVRAAFEYDINLYQEAQAKRVMLASPATIMPLVLLIAHAWKQHKSAENAVKLSGEIVELGNRLKAFFTHVAGMGAHLSNATKKFNLAVGSWESRVSTKIEEINKLGGTIQTEIQIQLVEEEPRALNKPLALEKPVLEE
ncbi:MAG: DNA recombination protein RmuC [Patescibacteria group bacterium]